eukprot:13455365-Alexandrium_andersonii.AAC.1
MPMDGRATVWAMRRAVGPNDAAHRAIPSKRSEPCHAGSTIAAALRMGARPQAPLRIASFKARLLASSKC